MFKSSFEKRSKNKFSSLRRRVVDYFAKAIVILISLVATIWFFTTFAKPNSDRLVILASLFVPVVVYTVYMALDLFIHQFIFRRKFARLDDLPIDEKGIRLRQLIAEEIQEVERRHLSRPGSRRTGQR